VSSRLRRAVTCFAALLSPFPVGRPWSLTVDDIADLVRHGSAVDWRVRFTCPAGEPFRIGASINQTDPVLPEPYAWHTWGVTASGSATGTCLGKLQRVTLRLVVSPTTVHPEPASDDRAEQVVVPLMRGPQVDSWARLFTPTAPGRGNPFSCRSDEIECEDATQIGPPVELS